MASLRLAFESASTARIGPSPCATNQLIVSAESVVLPTPPFPVIATIMTTHLGRWMCDVEVSAQSDCAYGTHPPIQLLTAAADQGRGSNLLAQLRTGFVERLEHQFGIRYRQ